MKEKEFNAMYNALSEALRKITELQKELDALKNDSFDSCDIDRCSQRKYPSPIDKILLTKRKKPIIRLPEGWKVNESNGFCSLYLLERNIPNDLKRKGFVRRLVSYFGDWIFYDGKNHGITIYRKEFYTEELSRLLAGYEQA